MHIIIEYFTTDDTQKVLESILHPRLTECSRFNKGSQRCIFKLAVKFLLESCFCRFENTSQLHTLIIHSKTVDMFERSIKLISYVELYCWVFRFEFEIQ